MRFTLRKMDSLDLEAARDEKPAPHTTLHFRRAFAVIFSILLVLVLWSAAGIAIIVSSSRLSSVYVELLPGAETAPETINVTFKAEMANRLPFGHALGLSGGQCTVTLIADPLASAAVPSPIPTSPTPVLSATLVRVSAKLPGHHASGTSIRLAWECHD